MRNLIFTFGMVAILWTIAVDINTSENGPSGNHVEELPRIGFKAPGFELLALDGKEYGLEGVKGKPVVINFWASWCGPCRLEAPDLVELYEKYGENIEIYAVNQTFGDSEQAAKAFANEYGFKFPVLLDKVCSPIASFISRKKSGT